LNKFKLFIKNAGLGISLISILLVLAELIWGGFGDKLPLTLLQIYISSTITIYFLIYIDPIFIKKLNSVAAYIIYAVQLSVIYILVDMIFRTVSNNFKITSIFKLFGILLIVSTITYIAIYFAQKAYYKRINKKLNEYKQNNDDK
jgi:hypothetical protein